MREFGPEVDIALLKHKEKIKEKYGEELAGIIGELMTEMVISILLHAKHSGIDHQDILNAFMEVITFINNYAENHIKKLSKAKNN